MKGQNKGLSIQFLNWMVIGMLIFALCASTTMAATYQTTLSKGTEVYVVEQYSDAGWKSTVNSTSNPSDWFEGHPNITGAESKITLKGYIFRTWDTYDVFRLLFLPSIFSTQEIMSLLGILAVQGYNETNINSNYTSTYELWYGMRAVWNFTEGEYDESPSYSDGISVLADPSGYKTMLDDYEILSSELNGNPFIPFTFPNITADEFLWYLALNGLAIAEPQSEYLTNLISELGCQDASAIGSTLRFQRYGVSNYTVEIEYGIKGMISKFTVKNDAEIVIFQVVNTNSDWIFFAILLSVLVFGGAAIILAIIRKRKLKKR